MTKRFKESPCLRSLASDETHNATVVLANIEVAASDLNPAPWIRLSTRIEGLSGTERYQAILVSHRA